MLVHLQLLLSHLNAIPHQTTRCADCHADCRDSDRKFRHTMGYLAARISERINADLEASLSRLHDELAGELPMDEAERRAYRQCLQDLALSIHRHESEVIDAPPLRTLCAVK